MLVDILLTCTKDILKMPDKHPLKVKFEAAILDYFIERWGCIVVQPAKDATPMEQSVISLRNAAAALNREADRMDTVVSIDKLGALAAWGEAQTLETNNEKGQ